MDRRYVQSIGTLVVNLGEMLQLRTRGYYLATPHRVVSKASGAGSPSRLSVPYFWNPRLDAVIEPIESLPETLTWLRPEPEDVAETGSHGSGGNRLIGEYGFNALKSLARSTPEDGAAPPGPGGDARRVRGATRSASMI